MNGKNETLREEIMADFKNQKLLFDGGDYSGPVNCQSSSIYQTTSYQFGAEHAANYSV